MSLSFCITYRTLFVTLLCPSCIIFTLATAELSQLDGKVLISNSSLDLTENKTVNEGVASPPLVPALVDVIHGKNTVIHEIHGSIDEIPTILMKTEIKPDDIFASTTPENITSPTSIKEPVLPVEQRLLGVNISAPEAPPLEPQQNTTAGGDDIPSFSEWAKKHMAEAGRTKGENLTVGNSGGAKLRFKNYASPDCGAKVVASNPEAISASAILSSTRDDYMLNPCNVKIWFVVELCEPIQPQRIEIANFELFSSSPHELTVYTSDRYPSRDWSQTGALIAKDERTVQSFQLPRASHFVKYLKVELHSHYGSEHYCPISLFRAYGTSEIEVLENVDGEEAEPDDGDEDVLKKRDLLEELEIGNRENAEANENKDGDKTNIFGSAKAAVLSIVKKAAEVLVKTPGNESTACGQGGTEFKHCFTPGYKIVCSNCSQNFYSKLYEILCCQGSELQCLLANPFISSVVSDTQLCTEIGIGWNDLDINRSNISVSNYSRKVEFIKAFLPRETIAALCNYLAVTRKRLVLNTTIEESVQNNTKVIQNQTNEVNTKEQSKEIEEENKPDPSPTVVSEEAKPPPITVSKEDIVVKPTPVVSESQLNTTAPPAVTVTEAVNVTTEKKVAPPEEVNDTLPMEPSSNDEPVTLDPIVLDSLFPEPEEEHEKEKVPKVKQDDAAEQEEAKVATVAVQKESVFVRLANRIKALEVNMSLSSQYLEELSRRYKKQVEELQRNLNSVLEDRRLASERESAQGAQLAALSQKVEILSMALNELITERDSWSNKALVFGQHGLIVFLEVLGFIAFVWLWRKMGTPPPSKSTPSAPNLVRRHSAEEPIKRNICRRPSEEACLPSGGTHTELLTEAPNRKVSREGARKRKRRRKGGEVVVIGGGEGDWQPLEPAPDFIKTAMWHRGKRSSQTQTSSSQEALSISSDTSKPKKTGAIRRIVKKLF